MKVVIVAKTRQGSGACIGGLTFDGRSVRLVAHDRNSNDHFNQEYDVGDVWDVEYGPDPAAQPPHVENIIVHSKRRQPPIDDLPAFINYHMPPIPGGLEVLFEGLTEATPAGVLYIAERTGAPPYSTMFWRPDQPLARDDDAKRIRYRYPTADGGRTLTFVGFQEPEPEIPAGAILRVSLAHWWRPRERPDGELRCYVQLSGWFLPEKSQAAADDWFLKAEETGPDAAQPLPGQLPEPIPAGRYTEPQEVLQHVFGYDAFWPLQAGIIENVLAKQDSLAIMPTGSGKSLCYQLPALLFPGLTVVASPLISLMEDQVMALRELGVPALFLNSTLNYDEHLSATQRIREGAVKLLYAAPETLLRPETLLLLEKSRVDCLTIDEAHCISEWGHDFRPEYRQLVELRRRLPDATCLAVTATATERVRQDIKANLGIDGAGEFVSSFDRHNLFLAVEPKTDGLNQTLAFLERHRDESGIIYCATRNRVDELAWALNDRGWPALPYHAGLDSQTRRQHQRRFSRDEVPIMVATIAFGMGINKSSVRFIVHYDLPKNLESYYQQIGRAGRDGLPAECLLLFSYADIRNIQFFINQQAAGEQPGAQMRLNTMVAFAETGLCRRRPLLDYFGEAYTKSNCRHCDNCTVNAEELADLTVPAQKFLSCVHRTGGFFGANHIINVLRGSRAKTVLDRGHDRLSTYDIGREYSQKEWQFLARQFIQHGLLTQDMEHGSLKITPQGRQVMRGETFYGRAPELPKVIAESAPAYDQSLFERLRGKRRELAEAVDVPPYVIFSDRTLVEMASYFPQSRASLAQIYGLGDVKLKRYGADFLALIQTYCQERGITEQPKTRRAGQTSGRSTGRGKRSTEIAEMFNSGQEIDEIAQQFNILPSTVINHLGNAVQAGIDLRQTDLLARSQLPTDRQRQVLNAFAEHGADYLRPVYDALGETVGWDELRLLRLYYIIQQARSAV
jgi:ATP-dependent DNA helicase RecQ